MHYSGVRADGFIALGNTRSENLLQSSPTQNNL
jgi:hypothetical protein